MALVLGFSSCCVSLSAEAGPFHHWHHHGFNHWHHWRRGPGPWRWFRHQRRQAIAVGIAATVVGAVAVGAIANAASQPPVVESQCHYYGPQGEYEACN